MPDYQNGKIYKIWSPEGDDIYIGSTTEILCRRLAAHKSNYNTGRTNTSRILFEKYTDVRIELIEEFSCDKKSKLIAREGHYIRILDCVNKIIPDRTNKEWREQNKNHLLEKNKEYYEQNKNHLLEKSKEHYEKNKDMINEYKKEWYEQNKESIAEKQKKHYEQNKARILEKKKEYHETNKESIAEYKKEKIKCDCGCEITRQMLQRHKRTKKHIKLMENM